MAKMLISTKRIQIDKANARMVLILAAAAFVTMFSLVASRALLSQRGYQGRVIKEKKQALAQLKANNQAVSQLVQSYKAFAGTSDNVIGGIVSGSGDRDGDNAKIILDALPSKYDFPALATSVDKILGHKSFKVDSIAGIDDELNQSNQAAAPATAPIEIPFQVTVTGSFDGVQSMIDIFNRSIRPIKVSKLGFKGTDAALTANVTAQTYFQPEKKVQITTKVVK
jgi:hypothetical protein